MLGMINQAHFPTAGIFISKHVKTKQGQTKVKVNHRKREWGRHTQTHTRTRTRTRTHTHTHTHTQHTQTPHTHTHNPYYIFPSVVFQGHASQGDALSIDRASFTWSPDLDPTLKDVSVQVRAGSLVAVVGMVGAGKSSLLSALLGEMQKLSGRVCVQVGASVTCC